MHRLISEEAGHTAIAGAMSFVEHGEAELGRLEAEQRAEARSSARSSLRAVSKGRSRGQRGSP
jgi:hypothetical protein